VTSNAPLQQEGQNFVIVASMHTGTAMQSRIVGIPPTYASAIPAEPNLEDGYVWLMHAPQDQLVDNLHLVH
jgi:hypothetical protein